MFLEKGVILVELYSLAIVMQCLLTLLPLLTAALGFKIGHHAVGVLQKPPISLLPIIQAISVRQAIQCIFVTLQTHQTLRHSQIVPEQTFLRCIPVVIKGSRIVLPPMRYLSQEVAQAITQFSIVITHSILNLQPSRPSL